MKVKPGYKKTEIGVIPEDWDVGILRPFLRQDATYGIVKAGAFQKAGVPMLRGGDIVDGRVADDQPFITPEKSLEYSRTILQRDDAVIALVGYPGESAVIPSRLVGANISRAVGLLRVGSKLDPRYLVCFLNSPSGREEFLRPSAGSAQIVVNLAALNKLRLPVPPLSEQLAIAEALSDVDTSIAALLRLITKKRDLRQGAMERLLTGKTRLPGFTEPWQKKRLGDHVIFLKNGIQSRAQLTLDDPVRYLHYGDVHVSADIFLNLRNTVMPRLPSSSATGLARLEDGDIVFVDASEDLNGVGKSLEIVGSNGIEAVSGQHTIAARFDKSILADGYKRYLQFMPSFTTHLRRLAAGTKVYATNRKHIVSAEILLPKPGEQRAIADVLSDMEFELSKLGEQLEKTRALKQAMMQDLLTGRVRLPVKRDAKTDSREAIHG